MRFNTVIFDRDGVLTYFDVEQAISFFKPLVPMSLYELAQRWQQWGAHIGFPSTIEEEKRFFATFWQQLRQEYEPTETQYQVLLNCNYSDFMRCFPEVPDLLRELKWRGVHVGVLSNFSLASLESSLHAVGIGSWIDVACAST